VDELNRHARLRLGCNQPNPNVPKGQRMNAPILQARVIAEPSHARILIAELADRARQLLGPDITYRAQTRTARRTGFVSVYLTATRKEERLCHETRDNARSVAT
jgi:hypothetical protein